VASSKPFCPVETQSDVRRDVSVGSAFALSNCSSVALISFKRYFVNLL